MHASNWAREKEYEGLLVDLDDQMWKILSDDWRRYLEEKEESLALASNKTAKIKATKSSAKIYVNRMRFCITAGRIM